MMQLLTNAVIPLFVSKWFFIARHGYRFCPSDTSYNITSTHKVILRSLKIGAPIEKMYYRHLICNILFGHLFGFIRDMGKYSTSTEKLVSHTHESVFGVCIYFNMMADWGVIIWIHNPVVVHVNVSYLIFYLDVLPPHRLGSSRVSSFRICSSRFLGVLYVWWLNSVCLNCEKSIRWTLLYGIISMLNHYCFRQRPSVVMLSSNALAWDVKLPVHTTATRSCLVARATKIWNAQKQPPDEKLVL